MKAPNKNAQQTKDNKIDDTSNLNTTFEILNKECNNDETNTKKSSQTLNNNIEFQNDEKLEDSLNSKAFQILSNTIETIDDIHQNLTVSNETEKETPIVSKTEECEFDNMTFKEVTVEDIVNNDNTIISTIVETLTETASNSETSAENNTKEQTNISTEQTNTNNMNDSKQDIHNSNIDMEETNITTEDINTSIEKTDIFTENVNNVTKTTDNLKENTSQDIDISQTNSFSNSKEDINNTSIDNDSTEQIDDYIKPKHTTYTYKKTIAFKFDHYSIAISVITIIILVSAIYWCKYVFLGDVLSVLFC